MSSVEVLFARMARPPIRFFSILGTERANMLSPPCTILAARNEQSHCLKRFYMLKHVRLFSSSFYEWTNIQIDDIKTPRQPIHIGIGSLHS